MKKIAFVVLLALVCVGTVTAARGGRGYLIDAYALKNGGSLTIAIQQRASLYYIVFELDDLRAGLKSNEEKLPGYYGELGRPDVITEVCADTVHVWLTWNEDEYFLHYSWKLPLAEIQSRYFPIVCRGR